MDSKAFIDEVERHLVPISPIIEFAIKKQLDDIGTNRDLLTAEHAIVFIDRLTEALGLFLGDKEAGQKRKLMMSILRRSAPDYFEKHSLI